MNPLNYDSLNEYFVQLLKATNSNNYFQGEAKMMNSGILLTTFGKFSSLLAAKQTETNSMGMYLPMLSYLPTVLSQNKQQSLTIINTRKYLLQHSNNEAPHFSAINLVYLLRVFKQIRIVFCLTEKEVGSKDFFQLLQILAKVHKGFESQALGSVFLQSIGVLVEVADNSNEAKINEQLKKLASSNSISADAQKILKALQTKRIHLLLKSQNISSMTTKFLQSQVPVKINRKLLFSLNRHLLSASQVDYLNKSLNKFHLSTLQKIMDVLYEAIDTKQIFDENEDQRNKKLQDQIFSLLPLMNLSREIGADQADKNKYKRNQIYAFQAAYQILIQLYKLEDKLSERPNYKKYAQKSTQFCLTNSEQPLYQSIVGNVMSKIFETNSLYNNSSTYVISRYMHLFLAVFQTVENNNLRQNQYKMIEKLGGCVEKMIQFFYERIGTRITELTENKKEFIAPKKLMGLVSMIFQLIRFLNQLVHKPREPYLTLSTIISQKIIYIIYESLIFCSWKCYTVYNRFWSNEQKNLFHIDLYIICGICKKSEYSDLFKRPNSLKSAPIANKLNEYFGQVQLKRHNFETAIQFFKAGKRCWKVICACNLWLEDMLKRNQINIDKIQICLYTLINLGIIEQARKWCYKFMQVVDQNEQFIRLLEQFAQSDQNLHHMLTQIGNLVSDQVFLVKDQLFNEVAKSLKQEEWKREY